MDPQALWWLVPAILVIAAVLTSVLYLIGALIELIVMGLYALLRRFVLRGGDRA